MKPCRFPEQTTTWAENQPPYEPLPAFTNERETITLWQLSWIERLWIVLTGRLWLRQLNFGEPLQPQAPTVVRPFVSVGNP